MYGASTAAGAALAGFPDQQPQLHLHWKHHQRQAHTAKVAPAPSHAPQFRNVEAGRGTVLWLAQEHQECCTCSSGADLAMGPATGILFRRGRWAHSLKHLQPWQSASPGSDGGHSGSCVRVATTQQLQPACKTAQEVCWPLSGNGGCWMLNSPMLLVPEQPSRLAAVQATSQGATQCGTSPVLCRGVRTGGACLSTQGQVMD